MIRATLQLQGSPYCLFFMQWSRGETARRSPKGQVLLVLFWGFAECYNRKALRLRVQGVYLCK